MTPINDFETRIRDKLTVSGKGRRERRDQMAVEMNHLDER